MKVSEKNNFIQNWWRSIDQQSIIAFAILIAFSFMLVTTASSSVADKIGLLGSYFSSRQIIYLMIASILLIFFSSLSKRFIKRIAILGLFFNIVILIAVKFLGYEVKGAVRWIRILGFSYQPSEFVKPFFSVTIGWVLSMRGYDNFPSFRISIFLYIIVAALIVTQPDFGMLALMSLVFAIQLFVAGLPVIWILVAVITGILGSFGAYFTLPHVAARINKFLDPTGYENYQVTKSIKAFQHGGLYGRGPGEGTVKQHLPDSHTDFIFAVAGEEFGAIICVFLIIIFAFIVIRTVSRISKTDNKFVQIATVGLISQFALQAAINTGVTLNLLPTKGMTLPFVSYGGSSNLAMGIAIGMMLGLTKHKASLNKFKIHEVSI